MNLKKLFALICGLVLLAGCSESVDSDAESSSIINVGMAGSDQLAAYSTEVHLTSTMPPADVLSYQWSQLSGEPVLIVNGTEVEASFIAPSKENTLEFQLEVIDVNDDYFHDTVSIYVMNLPTLDMHLQSSTLNVDINNEVILNMALSKEAVLDATVYVEFSGSAVLGTHYSVGYSSGSSTTTYSRINALSTSGAQVLSVEIPANSDNIQLYIRVDDASMVAEDEQLSLIATIVGANNADYDDVSASLDLVNYNYSPVFTSATTHTITEQKLDTQYYATATDVDGDSITYAIIGGSDADLFTLDASTGHLQFIALTAYDEASPENNVYELILSASDGVYLTEQNLSLNVVADYQELAPVFTSSELADVDEGDVESFYTLEVYDPNDDTIVTLMSGEHTDYFSFAASSGDLRFASYSDYESPQVSDNTYYLTFTAADYKFITSFTLTINLQDLPELAPELSLSQQSSDNLRVSLDSVTGMDSYTLYYSDDIECIDELCADVEVFTYTSGVSPDFAGLAPITPYYFRSAGYYTSSGVSQLSPIYGYSTLIDSSSSAIDVIIESESSASVSWDLQDSADLVSYNLYVSANSCSDEQLAQHAEACQVFDSSAYIDGSASISGLEAGKTYHFDVLVNNSVFGDWYPNSITGTTIPFAVDGSTLAAENLSSTSLTLTWQEPANSADTGYIYSIIDCNPDCSLKYQSSTSSNSSQEINNLQPGTEHQFLISSQVGGHEVNSSALNLFTVPRVVAPAIDSTDVSISLDWAGTSNGAATSYNIYRVCTEDDDCSQGLFANTNETSYTFDNLDPGVLYSFIIGANAGEFETNSSIISANTVPSVPMSFSIAPLASDSNNFLLLNWSAASQAEGYRIYYQDGSLRHSITDSSETNATLDHPVPGNNYSYYVVAYNDAGESAASEVVTATTLPRQDLDDNLAYGFTATSLDISWISANGDGVEYIVNLFTCPVVESACRLESEYSTGNEQSITITDLQPANGYEFYISIVTNDLTLETASYSFISLPAAAVLSAFSELDGSAVSLTWDSNNSDTASFSVYRYLCSDASFSVCSFQQQLADGLDSVVFSYSDTAADPNKYYQYSIGTTSNGTEVNSSIVNAEKSQATTPGDFNASVSAANLVSLQWQASSHHTSYTLTRSDGEGNSVTLSAPAVDATSASDSSNIISAESYTYQLTSANFYNQSEPASSSVISNPEISSASITNIGADSVSVDITSANGSMAVYQLHIFDCTSGSCVSVVDGTATSELSTSAAGLQAGSDLQLNLSTSANGTSVSSANQEFTTLPAAVTGLSVAVPIDGSTIDLSWESSNGSATELKVYRHVCTDATYSDCAFEQLLATLDHSATSYTDNQFELEPYYQYQIGAVTAANEANSSVVSAIKPEPVAGATFTAAENSEGILLNWSAASNHTYYSLSRVDSQSVVLDLATLQADALQYTDTSSQPGASYIYSLVAGNAYSAAAAVQASIVIAPVVITDLSASAIGTNSATISWSSANAFATSQTLYLELCDPSCNQVAEIAIDGEPRTYQLDDLQAGSDYRFWLVASNAGIDVASSEATFTTIAQIGNFSADQLGSTSVTIVFEANASSASTEFSATLEDCSAIVCSTSSAQDISDELTTDNGSYTYSISDLTPGSDYELNISVSNASAEVNASFNFVTLPVAVSDLTLGAYDATSAIFNWQSNNNGVGSSLLLRLDRCTDSVCETDWQTHQLAHDASSHTLDQLTPDRDYRFYISSINSADVNVSSAAVEFLTHPISVTDFAISFIATDGLATLDDYSAVDFSFDVDLSNNTNQLTAHEQDCSSGACSATSSTIDQAKQLVELGPDTYRYTWDDLHPASEYSLLINNSNASGQADSSRLSFTTDFTANSAPLMTAIATDGNDSAPDLDFAIETSNGLQAQHIYLLQRLDATATVATAYQGNFYADGSFPYTFAETISDLNPGTTYQFQTSVVAAGASVNYNALDQQNCPAASCAQATTYPQAITDISLSDRSETSLTLNYSQVNGAATSYQAQVIACTYYLGGCNSYIKTIYSTKSSDIGPTSAVITGLTPETYYQINLTVSANGIEFTTRVDHATSARTAEALSLNNVTTLEGTGTTIADLSWDLPDSTDVVPDALAQHYYLSTEECSPSELSELIIAESDPDSLANSVACGALVKTTIFSNTATSISIDLWAGASQYVYLVRELDGYRSVSLPVSVLTAPSAPSNFRVTSSSSETEDTATVTVKWSGLIDRTKEGGLDTGSDYHEIDGFRIYAVNAPCSLAEAQSLNSSCLGVSVYDATTNSISYVDPAATKTAQTYYYYLVSYNSVGETPVSSTVPRSITTEYKGVAQKAIANYINWSKLGYWSAAAGADLYYLLDASGTIIADSFPSENVDGTFLSYRTGLGTNDDDAITSIQAVKNNILSEYLAEFTELYIGDEGSDDYVPDYDFTRSSIDPLFSPIVVANSHDEVTITLSGVESSSNYQYQIFRTDSDDSVECRLSPGGCQESVTVFNVDASSSSAVDGIQTITYIDDTVDRQQYSTYYYIIREVNTGESLVSSYSNEIEINLPLQQPVITAINYDATNNLNGDLMIYWSDYGEHGVGGFEIYSYSNSGCSSLLDNYQLCDDARLSFSNTYYDRIDKGYAPNDKPLYYRVRSFNANLSISSELSDEVRVDPQVNNLNDTGILVSGKYSGGNDSSCKEDDISANMSDCETGRDAEYLQDPDAFDADKVGRGDGAFDYTKLGADGSALARQDVAYDVSGHEEDNDEWVCVQDNVTGLTWESKQKVTSSSPGNDFNTIHDEIHNFGRLDDLIADLNAKSTCGYNDWRLPSVSELFTILDFYDADENVDDESAAVDAGSGPFANLSPFPYWTSDKANGYRYLVRFNISTRPIVLTKTKYNYWYRSLFVRGKPIASNRGVGRYYYDSAQATVVDNNTRLRWPPCFIGQSYEEATNSCSGLPTNYRSWQAATEAAANFSIEDSALYFRLPNIKEVQTLLDPPSIDQSGIALDGDFFPGVNSLNSSNEYYIWSSSPAFSNDDDTHVFPLNDGVCCSGTDREDAGDGNSTKQYIVLPIVR